MLLGPPEVAAIEPATGGAMYVGDVGGPLVVRLTGPAQGATDVTVTSGDEALATVVGTVTVPDGADSAALVVTAVAATNGVTITAKIGVDGEAHSASLRIVPADTVPQVVDVEAPETVYADEVFDVTVTLDLPAKAGGFQADIVQTPEGVVTGPESVLVPAGAYSVTVVFTAGATAGTVTLDVNGVEADVTVSDAPPRPRWSSASRTRRASARW